MAGKSFRSMLGGNKSPGADDASANSRGDGIARKMSMVTANSVKNVTNTISASNEARKEKKRKAETELGK